MVEKNKNNKDIQKGQVTQTKIFKNRMQYFKKASSSNRNFGSNLTLVLAQSVFSRTVFRK
jgi:hypothetical protein